MFLTSYPVLILTCLFSASSMSSPTSSLLPGKHHVSSGIVGSFFLRPIRIFFVVGSKTIPNTITSNFGFSSMLIKVVFGFYVFVFSGRGCESVIRF